MKALLDGDIFAYRTAAASEEADESICLLRLDRSIREILHIVDCDTYDLFISGEDNFRYKIFPEYKANRTETIKPRWLQSCREYLATEWKATFANGCEADDLMGVNQTEDTIICSLDKDLLQIPGKHYQWEITGNVKGKTWKKEAQWYDITYIEGLRFFYEQLLKGDRTDGIPGVEGLGNVRAKRLLQDCETEQQMFDICRDQYKNDILMTMYGACLWIWRKENDIWNPTELIGNSQSDHEEEVRLDSTMQTEEEINQSSELISLGMLGYPALGN